MQHSLTMKVKMVRMLKMTFTIQLITETPIKRSKCKRETTTVQAWRIPATLRACLEDSHQLKILKLLLSSPANSSTLKASQSTHHIYQIVHSPSSFTQLKHPDKAQ